MITETKDKQLKVNGVNLSYRETGTGNPLVFIHGFPFNKSSWDPQAEPLSKKHRVIAYDIRGYGGSEAGSEQFSIDLFASDLLQFIDALGLKNVTACGLSMGGYILMNAVCRFPEKFTAIVLADTQCIADSQEGKEKRFKTIDKINNEGLESFAQGFVPNVFCKQSLENKKDTVERVRKMIVGADKKSVTGTLKALAERKETCTQLKKLKLPALIVCGKEDTVTPLSQSELLNNTISGSRLQIIANAGHLSNLEQPDAFNDAVGGFLKENG